MNKQAASTAPSHTARGPGGHLGGDVVGGPAEGGGPGVLGHVLLAHPKVGDLDVSLGVQQHVVQLQVPGGGGRDGDQDPM